MEILHGKKSIEIGAAEFKEMASPYREVVIDIGTGDGKFIYELARKQPGTFCIGVDAARENLATCSSKIYKKPARGGMPNALYVIANAEKLPDELSGIAAAIWIILPWGSLLKGSVLGDPILLRNITKIARPGAALCMFVNYDLKYEPAEIHKLNLPELSFQYIEGPLTEIYLREGIIIEEWNFLDNKAMRKITSTWARRLGYGRARNTLFIRAAVLKAGTGVFT